MVRIRALLELMLRLIDTALGFQREGPGRAVALKQRALIEAELAALDLPEKSDDAAPLA